MNNKRIVTISNDKLVEVAMIHGYDEEICPNLVDFVEMLLGDEVKLVITDSKPVNEHVVKSGFVYTDKGVKLPISINVDKLVEVANSIPQDVIGTNEFILDITKRVIKDLLEEVNPSLSLVDVELTFN